MEITMTIKIKIKKKMRKEMNEKTQVLNILRRCTFILLTVVIKLS